MSLSHEVCYTFFAEAYEALSKGQRFAITLPDEGKATTYRFQLHRWRNDNRQELPEGYGEIVIKIRPAPVIESVSAFEDGGPSQPFVLYAELDRDDELFLSSMQEALGREIAQAPSAVELLNSIKETTDENDN